ncbi:MAG: hypothetical protein Q8P68_03835 [Candidatus Peregrinibacteria bacterium]|nr:hypothetical protein [Candidatus Peregrinibacteria bacterium]
MVLEKIKSIVSPVVLGAVISIIAPACATTQHNTRTRIESAIAAEGGIEQMEFENFSVRSLQYLEFQSRELQDDKERCNANVLFDGGQLPTKWPKEKDGLFTFRLLEDEFPTCRPADEETITRKPLIAIQLTEGLVTRVWERAKIVDGEPNGKSYFKLLAILGPSEEKQPWGGLIRNNWGSDGLFMYDPAVAPHLATIDRMLTAHLADLGVE